MSRPRSQAFRDLSRTCLNALITTLTLLPVLYAAIVQDAPGLLAEIVAQAVVVAGLVGSLMRISRVSAWLASVGIGPGPAAPPDPPANPPPEGSK